MALTLTRSYLTKHLCVTPLHKGDGQIGQMSAITEQKLTGNHCRRPSAATPSADGASLITTIPHETVGNTVWLTNWHRGTKTPKSERFQIAVGGKWVCERKGLRHPILFLVRILS